MLYCVSGCTSRFLRFYSGHAVGFQANFIMLTQNVTLYFRSLHVKMNN